MEKVIAEMKATLAALTHKMSKIELDAADTRIHLKALGGEVSSLSGQVQNLDKLVEAVQKVEAQVKEQKATTEAKQMSMTEIGALYKKDPVAARKAMEAQGMKIDTGRGGNPWIQRDLTEQKRIRSIDPELANRLEAQAAAHYAASIR
jgi:type I site-specific restriction endonuclease